MSIGRHDTNRALQRAQPQDTVDGDLLQAVGSNLDTDFSTTAIVPTYTTLLSASLTALESSSFLDITFYCAWDFTGPPALTFRRGNVRFRLNGTLIAASRACSQDTISDANGCFSFNRRVAISGGLQTVEAEVAIVAGVGVATIQVDAATRPDEHGAHLMIRETR